jgi:hypothetical protein
VENMVNGVETILDSLSLEEQMDKLNPSLSDQ